MTESYRSNTEVATINWENLSLEELIEILDRIGLGFWETLHFLLSMLGPGQKTQLMKLVQQLEFGKFHRYTQTKQKLEVTKKDPTLSNLMKNILKVLNWRQIRKMQQQGYDPFYFERLPQVQYKPIFVR